MPLYIATPSIYFVLHFWESFFCCGCVWNEASLPINSELLPPYNLYSTLNEASMPTMFRCTGSQDPTPNLQVFKY